MKKTALLLLAASLFLSLLSGCAAGEPAPSGTAVEIADKIFAESGVESFGMSQSLEKDEDREFYLGTKDYPAFADAVVILPMISIDTRVLVIIKAADKGDLEAIKTKLEENIDPDRLICVTFSLEDVVIDSRGDVVFMTINSKVEGNGEPSTRVDENGIAIGSGDGSAVWALYRGELIVAPGPISSHHSLGEGYGDGILGALNCGAHNVSYRD